MNMIGGDEEGMVKKLIKLLAAACWTILAVSVCCLDSDNPAPFILAGAASMGVLAWLGCRYMYH